MTRVNTCREIICVEVEGGKHAHAALFWTQWYLPIQSAYLGEIIERARHGVRMGQVCLLQSDGSRRAIFALIRRLWQRIRELGLQEVYIAVDPDEVARWQRIGFQDTRWGTRKWGFADYADVIVMVLHVESAALRTERSLRAHFLDRPAAGGE